MREYSLTPKSSEKNTPFPKEKPSTFCLGSSFPSLCPSHLDLHGSIAFTGEVIRTIFVNKLVLLLQPLELPKQAGKQRKTLPYKRFNCSGTHLKVPLCCILPPRIWASAFRICWTVPCRVPEDAETEPPVRFFPPNKWQWNRHRTYGWSYLYWITGIW